MIKARAIANGKIGQTLYQKARSGDTRALIWWSKTQMGWTGMPFVPQNGHDDQDFAKAISDDHDIDIRSALITTRDLEIIDRFIPDAEKNVDDLQA